MIGTPPARRPDAAGGLAWMVLGLALVAGAWRMDRFEQMGATLHTAPGLVPGLYGLLMLALGAALAWRQRAGAAVPAAGREPLLNRRVLAMLGLTLGYAVLAVGRLPFGASTAVFVALFCALYDTQSPPLRRALVALAAGVGTAVVVVLVFERVFLVRLP
jgi:hypothetical protein